MPSNGRNIELHLCQGLKMTKLRGLSILMAAALVAIAGFQVYWIKDNYDREKKAVEVKAQALFRETVREVQDGVLQKKLRLVLKDTSQRELKKSALSGQIKLKEGTPRTARVLHVLSEQLSVDSSARKKGLLIHVENGKPPRGTGIDVGRDSATIDKVVLMRSSPDHGSSIPRPADDRPTVWRKAIQAGDSVHEGNVEVSTIYFNTREGNNFKISVDSLFKDSLPVSDIYTAYSKKLQEQKLNIPFEVLRQAPAHNEKQDFVRRPFAIESFEGYKLELGNAFAYLTRQVSMPILFSFFLVGLSILAFVLLYRNLLRQHRLAEMKNELISNITHELKTPIATVGVAIEALKNFNAIQDPERTKEYLDISQNELERLSLLVDKVLKLSMFENHYIEINKEVVDLEEVVKEVIQSLKLQAQKNNATIAVHTAGNLLVRGDRLHLVSVVFNLLDNALRYNKGSADIQVSLEATPEQVILKVADNGVGIPQQYKNRIFDKFFRVPSGNTHNAKGHGLGLSYVAQVVSQHQGTISVESQEGNGSTFTIFLPKPGDLQNA